MLQKKVGSLRVGWYFLAPITGVLFSAGPLLAQGTSSSQNPSVVFSTPGTKSVTLTACNNAGCDDVTQTVTVLNPQPAIVSTGGIPPLLGAGQTVSLTAQTTGRPTLTHTWRITGTGTTTGSLVLTGNPVTWNTLNPGIGTYQVQLELQNTAGTVTTPPVAVTIERMTFSDVPPVYWAWSYAEILYARGISSGCSGSPLSFCPLNNVLRSEMAAFLVRAVHGASFVPPPPTGLFADVPVSYWAAPYIEQIFAESITAGCAASPLRFCPDDNLTRAEMAVFLLRAKHGAAYVPPVATGTVFTDVPSTYWAASWIEQLAAEGITTGCASSPARFCPEDSVRRDQMAAFLVRTFNLTLP